MKLHPGHHRHHQVAENQVESLTGSAERKRFPGVDRGDDVMLLSQNSGENPDYHVFVVDDENPPATAARCYRRGRDTHGIEDRLGERYPENRPDAKLASTRQLSADVGHNAMADGETESAAASNSLGGEDRIEYAIDVLGRNSGSGIGDLDHDALALESRNQPNLVVLGAAFGNRLRGIDDEIEKHLPQPGLIRIDVGNVAVILDEPRPMPNLIPRHPQ